MKRHALALAVLALLCAPVFAQGGYYSRAPAPGQVPPLQVLIEGGAAVTVGNTSNFLDSGFTIGGGVLWHPEPGPLALRTMFDYTRLGASSQLINDAAAFNQANIDGGSAQIYSLRLNGLYEWPLEPYGVAAHGYVTLGLGVAHEEVDFTQTILQVGSVCSWWVCGTAVTPQEALVAHNSTTRFTWNVGAGVNFPLGGWESFFVEAAFERVNTPQATTFVPLRLGVRF
jgi:hypothetical protein